MKKVVIVTGCASSKGIGWATARRLANAGYQVVATVREQVQAAALQDDADLEVMLLDLHEESSIVYLIEEVVRTHGQIDALVNNAGFGLLGALEQLTLDQIRAQFETNLFGPLRLTQEVLPVMRKQGNGMIVNLCALLTLAVPPPGLGVYLASKAALETAMEGVAAEVARWNIRVVNLNPGGVITQFSRELGNRLEATEDPYHGTAEALPKWFPALLPPYQQPQEVAAVIHSLLENSAPPLRAFTSGECAAFAEAHRTDPSGEIELAERMQFSTQIGRT